MATTSPDVSCGRTKVTVRLFCLSLVTGWPCCRIRSQRQPGPLRRPISDRGYI